MHLLKFENLEGKSIYINKEYVVAVVARGDHTVIDMEGDFAIHTNMSITDVAFKLNNDHSVI